MKLAVFSTLIFIINSCTQTHKVDHDKSAIIILKMDDLEYTESAFVHNWERYVDSIRSYQIKSGLGIISDHLTSSPQSFKDSLISWHQSGNFEIWHHGWDHQKNNYPPDSSNIGEFAGTPYDYQKDHLETGEQVIKEELGIIIRSFGAPYNKTDDVFTKVISQSDSIRVWLYCQDTSYPYMCLGRGEENKLESKTGVVSFRSFLKGYNKNKNPYLVLQGHPGKWDDQSFLEFEKVILFLKEQKHDFMLPYEYFQLINQ